MLNLEKNTTFEKNYQTILLCFNLMNQQIIVKYIEDEAKISKKIHKRYKRRVHTYRFYAEGWSLP